MKYKIITAPSLDVLEIKVNEFLKSKPNVVGGEWKIKKAIYHFESENEPAKNAYQIHLFVK